MITTLVRRVVPVAILGTLLVLVIRVQDRPDVGADAWFHLRFGREFLDTWSIADPGHLGRFDTENWIPTQWLPQVTMAAVESWGGVAAVMWLAGVVILALPVTTYLVCRSTAAPLPAVLATALSLMAAAPGLSARPQVVSYVLIALFSGAWLATARDGRARWWLVPLTWAWVPLHGMWVVGVLIGIVVVAGMALDRRHPGKRLLMLATIPTLGALTAALTPLGTNVYASLRDVSTRTDHLDEWNPPDFTSPHGLVLAGILALLIVLLLRQGEREWARLLFTGLAIAWALYTQRTTVVAGIMVAPLLADAAQRFVPEVPRPGKREVVAVVAAFAVACGALWLVCQQRADAPVVPTWVDDRLSSLPEDAAVLNDWNIGPYLLWRHPDLQLVMHGYVDVFTAEEVERNVDITTLQPGWDEKVAELDVDGALVERDSRLRYALEHTLGWSVVQGDDDYVFLRPR